MGNSGPSVFTWGALASSLPTPPTPSPPPRLPPTHPLVTLLVLWGEIGAHLRKNRLKRLKIKQVTTSKVNCILFNRLLNPVLQNKSGLVRAKAGNFNLKSLNRCFFNYYQVRTWRVFTEPVTYVTGFAKTRHNHTRTKIQFIA